MLSDGTAQTVVQGEVPAVNTVAVDGCIAPKAPAVGKRKKVSAVWFICASTGVPVQSYRVTSTSDPRTALDFASAGTRKFERQAGLVSYLPRELTTTYSLNQERSAGSVRHYDLGSTWANSARRGESRLAVHQLLANIGVGEGRSRTEADLGCLDLFGCGLWTTAGDTFEQVTCDEPGQPSPRFEIETVATTDIDGDGAVDKVEVWDEDSSKKTSDYRLRISFADGTSTHPIKVVFDESFLSSIDLDGDNVDEIWIHPSGNTAHVAELYRIEDCWLRPVIEADGGQPFNALWFASGNSALYTAVGVKCEGQRVVVTFIGPPEGWSPDLEPPTSFEVSVRTYRLIDSKIRLVRNETETSTEFPDPRYGPFGFTCK